MLAAVRFLCRCDEGPAAAWWAAVAAYPHGAPGIVRELLAGGSVVCDPTEVDQAIAWAERVRRGPMNPPPMYAVDPEIR